MSFEASSYAMPSEAQAALTFAALKLDLESMVYPFAEDVQPLSLAFDNGGYPGWGLMFPRWVFALWSTELAMPARVRLGLEAIKDAHELWLAPVCSLKCNTWNVYMFRAPQHPPCTPAKLVQIVEYYQDQKLPSIKGIKLPLKSMSWAKHAQLWKNAK